MGILRLSCIGPGIDSGHGLHLMLARHKAGRDKQQQLDCPHKMSCPVMRCHGMTYSSRTGAAPSAAMLDLSTVDAMVKGGGADLTH